MSKKRVFVCGIHQESNAFNPIPTPLSMFWRADGDNVKRTCIDSRTSTGGLVSRLEAEDDIEMIYSTVMSSSSGAPMSREVVCAFHTRVMADLKAAGHIDAVALSMHGATMSADSDDVCGDLIECIRNEVGDTIPFAAAFDLHANITEKIAKHVDCICGFHEYPHIDQRETGVRAAELLLRKLRGEPTYTARVTLPMIAPAHAYTTQSGGLLALVSRAGQMVKDERILDYSIFAVQPWLDVCEMASTVIVTASDEKTAKLAASELAADFFALRHEMMGEPLCTADEIIQKALSNKSGKPIVLVDSADSRGAGSTADSAAVIGALLPYRDRLRCAVGVCDAAAVEKAFALGVGGKADFRLGAGVAPLLSEPVDVPDACVRSLHNGYFNYVGPISRGAVAYCGRVAVLQVGKILIQVSENSRAETDIGFFRGFGIDPAFCDLVSVKACTSFRAGYTPIAAEICNANTPGAAGVVLTDLPYQKRPAPLYPFEEIDEASVSEAICYR